MIPKRADPVAGALFGTIVLAAFLAPLALVAALVVWLVRRAGRTSSQPKPEDDQEFSARFQQLEESIVKASTADSHGRRPVVRRPRRSRTGRRSVREP